MCHKNSAHRFNNIIKNLVQLSLLLYKQLSYFIIIVILLRMYNDAGRIENFDVLKRNHFDQIGAMLTLYTNHSLISC